MLEITAALTMIFWTLGLFSGLALGAAVYVLPIVALTAIGLRVYEGARSRKREMAVPREPDSAPTLSPQLAQATPPDLPGRSTEHARAA